MVQLLSLLIFHAVFLRGQSLDRSISCYMLMTFIIALIILIFIYLLMTPNYSTKIKISPLYRQVLTINFLMSIPRFVLTNFYNFVIFHLSQRDVTFNFHLTLNGKQLQQDSCIKYLGIILIDSNLSSRPQIARIAKKDRCRYLV